MRIKLSSSLLVLGFAAIAVPAMAQSTSPSIMGGQNPGSFTPKGDNPAKPAVAPPAAIPGARARPGSVAPASRTAADLPPTEALFDAINRGDIATARDAVNRGADLDGTNVLGLTPLELSVDLSRNDITFMLLSMRGGDDGSRSAGPPSQTAANHAPPPAAAPRRRTPHIEVQKVASQDAPPPAHQTAALYAGNGGSPVPSAGFLGFDPHH